MYPQTSSSFRKKFLDLLLVVGTALVIIVIVVGAFVLTEIHHISPAWVFLSFVSLGFLAGAREDYRKQFWSVRFILFVCGWLVVNVVVIVVVLASFGWLYLFLALLLEQFLFYMTAYWLFGLEPPSRKGAGTEPSA